MPMVKQKASAVGGGPSRWNWSGLFGGGGFGGGFGFAGGGVGYLAAEALDAAGGVDQLLLAGEEGVAGRADFDDDVALVRGAGLKVVAAGAFDVDVLVLGVNGFFGHGANLFLLRVLPAGSRFACNGGGHRHIDLPVAPPTELLSVWDGEHDGMGLAGPGNELPGYPQSNLDSHTRQFDSWGRSTAILRSGTECGR
jgi:hypothetical protein